MKSFRRKTNLNKAKSCRVFVATVKTIDKDMQRMLLPLNLFHNILLCPKYGVRNNFINPNGFIAVMLGYLGIVLSFLSFSVRIYDFSQMDPKKEISSVMRVTSYFDGVFFSIGTIINFKINVLETIRNVSFVLKFQDVHRFLQGKTYFKCFTIWNWISIFSGIGFYIYMLLFSILTLNFPINDVFCGLALMFLDVNTIYCIRFIKLLSNKVDLWNRKALCMQHMDRLKNEDNCEKMFEAYVNILKCYEFYKESFQLMITYHTVDFFCHMIMKLFISIVLYKLADMAKVDDNYTACIITSCLYAWAIKTFLYEILLSVNCESFYIAMENVQTTCALILKRNCTEAERKMCKNIIRLHQATFDKIKVCGLFYIDAHFPLNMLALIANYIVVLLQFAFLY